MNLSLIERRDALIAEAKSLLPEDGRTMSGEVREQLSSMIEETEDLNAQGDRRALKKELKPGLPPRRGYRAMMTKKRRTA